MPRETKTLKIGSITIRVTQLPPRLALRTFVVACRIFGETGVKMLADVLGQVAEAKAKAKADGDDKDIDLASLEGLSSVQMISTAVSALIRANPDDVDVLADALIAGHCAVKTGDTWTDIPEEPDAARAMTDALFPNVHTLMGALRLALEVNYAPTSAGPATDDSTAPNSTEA